MYRVRLLMEFNDETGKEQWHPLCTQVLDIAQNREDATLFYHEVVRDNVDENLPRTYAAFVAVEEDRHA